MRVHAIVRAIKSRHEGARSGARVRSQHSFRRVSAGQPGILGFGEKYLNSVPIIDTFPASINFSQDYFVRKWDAYLELAGGATG